MAKTSQAPQVNTSVQTSATDDQSNGQAATTAPATTAVAEKAPKEPGSSPKSKKSRGVAEHLVTAWVDFNLEPAERERLIKAAKVAKKTLTAYLQDVLRWGIDQYGEIITKAVATFDGDPDTYGTKSTAKPKKPLEQMSAEELQVELDKATKAVAKQESAVERARRMIAEKQAALAASNGNN